MRQADAAPDWLAGRKSSRQRLTDNLADTMQNPVAGALSGAHSAHDTVTGQRVLLFLDIDGVLHPASHAERLRHSTDAIVSGRLDPRSIGLLCPHRQALLLEVLQHQPQVDIVISSQWRTWGGQDLGWLLALLDPAIARRVIGATPLFADEGLFSYQGGIRRREIRAFIEALPDRGRYAGGWVALDDMGSHFREQGDDGAAFFYHESTDNRFRRSCRSNTHGRSDEVILILADCHGLTRRSSRMLSAAVNHARGQDAGIAAVNGDPEPRLDVPRLAAMLPGIETGQNAAARIPASEWLPVCREVDRVLENRAHHAVQVIVIDTGGADSGIALVAMCRAVQHQLDLLVSPTTEAECADALLAYALEAGKRRLFIVCKSRLIASAMHDAMRGCIARLMQIFDDRTTSCVMRALVLEEVASGPPAMGVHTCPALDCDMIDFPDPASIAYFYDE